jgi:ribonuclease Z
MQTKTKIGLAAALLIFLCGATVYTFRPEIGTAMFERGMERNLDRDVLADLDDGLHIGLCGTGSPMPNPERAGPCNIVVAGDQMFIVDIGEGGGRNIALMGFDAGEIDTVYLTHLHSDHFDGMGPLQLVHWVRGAQTSPLKVVGPVGTETVVEGLNLAYSIDNSYRIAHHGETIVPPTGGGSEARTFSMSEASQIIHDEDGLRIVAFAVDHSPVEPAVGYRFDYKGRSLCISGDTSRSANLERVCDGVDLLVHEALQPTLVKKLAGALQDRDDENAAQIMRDVIDYHSSPSEAAQSADATNAQMLVLSHIVPRMPSSLLYPAFLGDAADHYNGPIIVGEDGMMFTLPAGSNEIERSNLL